MSQVAVDNHGALPSFEKRRYRRNASTDAFQKPARKVLADSPSDVGCRIVCRGIRVRNPVRLRAASVQDGRARDELVPPWTTRSRPFCFAQDRCHVGEGGALKSRRKPTLSAAYAVIPKDARALGPSDLRVGGFRWTRLLDVTEDVTPTKRGRDPPTRLRGRRCRSLKQAG